MKTTFTLELTRESLDLISDALERQIASRSNGFGLQLARSSGRNAAVAYLQKTKKLSTLLEVIEPKAPPVQEVNLDKLTVNL